MFYCSCLAQLFSTSRLEDLVIYILMKTYLGHFFYCLAINSIIFELLVSSKHGKDKFDAGTIIWLKTHQQSWMIHFLLIHI